MNPLSPLPNHEPIDGLQPAGYASYTLPSDQGGASGPETTRLVPAYEMTSIFDHRQICPRAIRHLAGDPEQQFTFSDCQCYANTGRCQMNPGEYCVFLVSPTDHADPIWRKVADWQLIEVPEIDRHGRPIPGTSVTAASYVPQSDRITTGADHEPRHAHS